MYVFCTCILTWHTLAPDPSSKAHVLTHVTLNSLNDGNTISTNINAKSLLKILKKLRVNDSEYVHTYDAFKAVCNQQPCHFSTSFYFTDPPLTVQMVKLIFLQLNDWAEPRGNNTTIFLFPMTRANIIRQHNASKDQQCSLASYYYVNISPWASWETLALMLYKTGQSKAAVDAFRVQLPKPKGM